jgi:hypothetical protein
MKFYIVQDDAGSTLGCELTLKAPRQLGHADAREGYSIVRVECPANAETVRRLLGNLGGYATESETVATVVRS